MRLFLIALLSVVAASGLPAPAQIARAPFTVQETGRSYAALDDAVQSIRTGTGTILIAPGVYHQCTVQAGGDITFRAVERGRAIFDGKACEGKAAFVLRGHSSTVDGLVFRNLRVPDGNGAGIRTEMGDLSVRNSLFLDSQEGILGGQPTGQKIVIDHSTFAGLGQCNETPDCAHSLYLANKGSVAITHSRFERGTGGHYVKLRVPHIVITDNSFDDSDGRKTNYMIDLCEGGAGVIARNTFADGSHKENWTGFIVIAAEARTYSSTGLKIVDNVATLAPGFDKSPAFVANVGRDQLAVGRNILARGIRTFEQR